MNSQSPPKGVTVPYTPLKALNVAGGVHSLPAFFPANSQAVVPHNPASVQPQVLHPTPSSTHIQLCSKFSPLLLLPTSKSSLIPLQYKFKV
jgi:hypothetical protein